MRMLRTFALFALVVLVSAPPVAAQQAPPRVPQRVAQLVEQLGSDTFQDREAAERELRKIGIPALAELLAARDADPDAEIRRRANRIVPEIEAADHAQRLEAFVRDTAGTSDHGLAGWTRFAALAGNGGEGRKLFAAMHEAEPKVMRQADGDPQRTMVVLGDRLAELNQPVFRGRSAAYQLSLPAAAALLFVGSRADLPLSEQSANQVAVLAQGPAFTAGMQANDPRREPMTRLLTEWVAQRSQGWTAAANLNIVQRFQLRDAGLKLCRDMITKPAGLPALRAQALVMLERFGSEKDVPVVESCFNDRGTCLNFVQQGNRLTVEVREVALAVAILLSGEKPERFGFDKLQRVGEQQLLTNSLDLGDAAAIDRALEKWRERAKTTGQK